MSFLNPQTPQQLIHAVSTESSIENMREKIHHVVVLMLENRSFDHLLGKLYPKSDLFNGLSGHEVNSYIDTQGNRHEVPTWNDPSRMNAPSLDPGESWEDINAQLFGNPTFQKGSIPSSDKPPAMKGFAQNFYEHTKPAKPDDIMFHYLPKQLPVLSTLARNYALCDAWFSSAPCQTYPNRFFLHSAMSGYGQEDNPPPIKLYDMPTIFNRFKSRNDWKIYGNGISPTLAFVKLWHYVTQFQSMADFHKDAMAGTLPKYSFIECGYLVDKPNDQHPPYDISYGEALIAEVYNALQASPKWKNTLFIITYDEGGGLYDHVPPPAVTPPEKPKSEQKFAFDRLGSRVPAVVISPYIKPGTIFRAKTGNQPFEHTAIIQTLRKLFDLGEPLTKRDQHAPDLSSVLSHSPDNLGEPIDLPILPKPMHEALRPISSMQKALMVVAALLPDMSKIQHAAEIEFTIKEHIKKVVNNELDLGQAHKDVKAARSFIESKLKKFFPNIRKK